MLSKHMKKLIKAKLEKLEGQEKEAILHLLKQEQKRRKSVKKK